MENRKMALIHSVLVFALFMTGITLYSFFADTGTVRYGN